MFWESSKTMKNIFWACLEFRLGNGADISFWEDNWMGEGCLLDKFWALFKIAKEPYNSIRDNLHEEEYKPKFTCTRDPEE